MTHAAPETVTVVLPAPYPDDTIHPYWVPKSDEPGQQISVDGPDRVSIEFTSKWRVMDAETARNTAAALLAAAKVADELDARSFPCVVDDCPRRFADYADLNRHCRAEHVQTTSRYPGADKSGDFTWFALP